MTEYTDPELSVHADDCRQQDSDTVHEIARIGLSFHFQTQMMHFMLACGRDDTKEFDDLQTERMALSDRITELQESLPDDVRDSLKMSGRLSTPKPAPAAPFIRLTLDKVDN